MLRNRSLLGRCCWTGATLFPGPDAIASLGFGTVHRLALLFPQVFWDRKTQFVGYISPDNGEHFELNEPL